MTPEQHLSSIIESLRLVAATPEVQISAIPNFASTTDEISTTFGDAYLLVPQLVKIGLVDTVAANALERLDDWFGQMPIDGSVGQAESLESHTFWNTARRLAIESLYALGQEVKPPDLSHITWIE